MTQPGERAINYADAVRAVVRVPFVCLVLLALSIVGYGIGLYSLVVVTLVLVGIVLAFPAWSGSIVGRTWRCPSCGKPLPSTFRFGLVFPREVSFCPHCEHPLR